MTLLVENLTVMLDGSTILRDVHLGVADGEVAAVLGASGAGKSTLLRAIAGIVAIERGTIRVDDRDITRAATHERRVGLVFQDHALFPHLDVARNIAYPLRLRGAAVTATRRERTRELLALVGLDGFDNRAVDTLSGGEAQRVALARALAGDPDVLCLDEPLASLDRPQRARLLDVLDDIFAEVGIPAVYVTHDRSEAFRLGDELVVLDDCGVARAGTPRDVWADPRTAAVARLVGYASIISTPTHASAHGELAVALDGADVTPAREGAARGDVLATVQSVRFDQGREVVVVELDDGQTLQLLTPQVLRAGDRVALGWRTEGTASL